ncbi:UNVERIFIED_CONTAM: hypothetical protein Sangu_0174100 [Sesamum angustifolium]|uniref:Pentatricopeptide repeat-containing protein n=1 Tax=Sesamum angustifolium TaxID=2727405 RepID=A0AAW2RMH6_9LAMI
MAAKNISRTSLCRRLPPPFHHQYSTATSAPAATKTAAWYTPPASRFNPILQDQDTILTALSQAIQNSPSKPLQVSLKSLLPSLKPQHVINLISLNPYSLSASSLFSFFTWLSSPGNSTFRHTFTLLDTKGTQRSDIYAFSGLMTAYLESGFVLDAIECFRFCREGEMRLARSVFYGIKRWGLRPSDVSFNTLINGYVRLGDLDEGFRLKNAMQASGIQPDVYTYSVLINGMCRERRMDDANEFQ